MPDSAASSADRDDEALLAACRAGDADAFVALTRRHHGALRALARCWPGGAHEAERAVAAAWIGVLGGQAPATPVPVRARAAREVVAASVARTGAPLRATPPPPLDATRFFADDHDLWPGEWSDPPRPWGAYAERRLAARDVPRVLARVLRGLGIGPSAVLTLVDLHGWRVRECALALDLAEPAVRVLLRAGREGVRAALEAEVDRP